MAISNTFFFFLKMISCFHHWRRVETEPIMLIPNSCWTLMLWKFLDNYVFLRILQYLKFIKLYVSLSHIYDCWSIYVQTFATLSPIPGFMTWLLSKLASQTVLAEGDMSQPVAEGSASTFFENILKPEEEEALMSLPK